MSSGILCYILCFWIVAVFGSVPPSISVFHSLDNGLSWHEKGKLFLQSGYHNELKFVPSFEQWNATNLEALIALNEVGGYYFLGVLSSIDIPSEDGKDTKSTHGTTLSVENHVKIAIAPCVIFNSNFQEEYSFYVSFMGQELTSVIGLQNHAMQLKVSARNFCGALTQVPPLSSPTAPLATSDSQTTRSKTGAASSPIHKASVRAFGENVKHRVRVNLAIPAKPPVWDEVGELAGPTLGGSRTIGGGSRPGTESPPQEKSFIQKYWMIILIALVIYSFQNAPPPPADATAAPEATDTSRSKTKTK